MKKFDFKLDPLYKYRKNIEKEKQALVAEVSAEYNKEQAGIDNCIAKIHDGINIVDSIEENSEDYMSMALYLGDYISALNSQINIHQDNMAIIEVELKKRQEVLSEATRARRAVEILKEKKLLEHKKQNQKLEQANLDEWKREYVNKY